LAPVDAPPPQAPLAIRRVAITGGPGGGKSTVAAAVARAWGERVVVVPEVATHLLGGFFPRVRCAADRRAVQRAIYHVQLELEAVHQARAGADTVLVFDRGLADGAAYWPEGADAFFTELSQDAAAARARYDAVLFLETAAAGGLGIGASNPARTEALAEAVQIDQRLRHIWSQHPRFHFVGHTATFDAKVVTALDALRTLIFGEQQP
jgi:predicted ATPase